LKELLKYAYNQANKSIKSITIFSSVFALAFIILVITQIDNTQTFWFYLGSVAFILVFLFIIFYVFVFLLAILGGLIAKKSTFGRVILVFIILLYMFFFYKGFITIAMYFYNEELGLSVNEYLSSLIAFMSLFFAIVMPLYLTEKNRQRAEAVAKQNQEYNEKLISDNRKHTEDMMLNEIRMRAVPIFTYTPQIVNSTKNTFLQVHLKNMSDRIATKISFRTLKIGSVLSDSVVRTIVTQQPLVEKQDETFRVNISDLKKEIVSGDIKDSIIVMVEIFFSDIYNNEYSETISIAIKKKGSSLEARFIQASRKTLLKNYFELGD